MNKRDFNVVGNEGTDNQELAKGMVQWNEKSIEKSTKDCNRDKKSGIYYS